MTKAGEALCALNRVIVALVSMAVLAGALELATDPEGAKAYAASGLNALRAAPPATLWTTSLIVAVVCVILLLLELWPRGGQQVLKAQVEGGTVEYPTSLVAVALERDLAEVEGISGARVNVRGHHQVVDLWVRLTAGPGDDPQAMATRIAGRVHDKLATMGLEQGKLRIAVRPGKQRGPLGTPRESIPA